MIPVAEHLRREVLRLDLHDNNVPQIAAMTGLNRSTVDQIIRRLRPTRQSEPRGQTTLIHDPSGIFTPGARFNIYDVKYWAKEEGAMAEGTTFEVLRPNGSTDRKVMRGGTLVAV